jgi:hypothetical protein
LPRFHDNQQVTGLKFEICSAARAVAKEFDLPAVGNPARGGVSRCTGIGGEPKRDSGHTVTRGTPFGVGAAANVAVAHEDDARHLPPSNLLELTISPSQIFEPRQRQAYEPAVSAKA